MTSDCYAQGTASPLGQHGGKANDGQQICQVMVSRRPATFEQRHMRFTMQVYKARVNQQPGNARYDTDSKVIQINNCASYSISFNKNDFITPLKPVRQKVKGHGGVLDGLQTGTIEWTINNDEGMPYVIKLPGSLFVPNSPSRLLSPQHWTQTASGDQPWCETYHNEVRQLWNGGQRKKTAKVAKQTGNVASIYTAPGFQAYHTFMEKAGLKVPEDLMVFSQNVISDDEASEVEEEIGQTSREHLRAQIRTQEVYMKKIISGIRFFFSGIPEINNSAIFSTYELCVRIFENATS
jgi:hypothetical protein